MNYKWRKTCYDLQILYNKLHITHDILYMKVWISKPYLRDHILKIICKRPDTEKPYKTYNILYIKYIYNTLD